MSSKHWPPNWRAAAEYPDRDATTLLQWVWEFLRRNPEYQRLWRDIVLPYYNEATGAIDAPAAMADARRRAEADPLFQRAPYAIANPLAVFREKFGIVAYPPPPEAPTPRLKLDHYLVRTGNAAIAPTESAITFDLALPIGPQLERARQILEEAAAALESKGEIERLHRANHIRHYQDYLRVLDGEASGATHKEMAAIIFPDEPNDYPDRYGDHKVRNALKAAKKLRDGGYRYIVL